MKIWRTSILFLGVAVLLISSYTALADTQTDGSNDVFHWNYYDTGWAWDYNVGDKPNIDISEISYSVDGNELTLTLKVDGEIASSDKIGYWAYYNSTDTAYWMSWMNGEGMGMAITIGDAGGAMDLDPVITASGDTITGVFDVIGSTDNVGLWGWAAEYTESGDQTTAEWWADWAPHTYAPWYTPDGGNGGGTNGGTNNTGTNGTGTGGTPGFEILTLLAAVAVAFIFFKRRK